MGKSIDYFNSFCWLKLLKSAKKSGESTGQT